MSARPLSPHLQIYRWYFTMALSIVHRTSGVINSLGLLLLTWWLVGLAGGPASFEIVHGLAGSILGRLVLFGWSFVIFFHLANGLRHLAWDLGYGFELATARRSGQLVLLAAAGLTALTWLALLVGG